MGNRKYVIIALLSVSIIALEVVWTRIFSAEFFYSFAFLVLSLAVMGLGLGALSLRLVPGLNRLRSVGGYLALTGLFALAGPPLVFQLGPDFARVFTSAAMIGKLIGAIVLLGAPFFCAGMVLALLFKQDHQNVPRLYMADLLGAGAGVFVAIYLMNAIGTPATVFWCSLPVLTAAFIACRRWSRILPLALAAAALVLGNYAVGMLEVDRPEHGPVIYKHWDAMSKIKLYGYDETYRGINIDNAANSPVYGFDGNWDKPDSMLYEFGIDVSNLIGRFDSCTFLSLGAGGGVDVLQALQYGAAEIHAVEVNPHINFMMTVGDPGGYLPFPPDSAGADSLGHFTTLAEFSGGIYHDPRVKVVTEDARIYVSRFTGAFDVIYSLSSNSWAALASGSFALAENYLFTTEAFRDYWTALSDSGFMMMEHQFYMPRLVSELIHGLEAAGVAHPAAHFSVYNLPNMRRNMILLSKKPLTDEIRRNAFGQHAPEEQSYCYLLYPAADSLQGNIINQIVANGWTAAADSATIDISPCTDDRPFTAQLGLWKNFSWDKLNGLRPYDFLGFPVSKMIIVIIAVIVIVLVIPINLVPYLGKREKLRALPWLYFFIIGLAFMAVEVILIQKYTLFVGPAVYSIAVILLTLLVSSGIGSRFSAKVRDRTAFVSIMAWLLLDIFIFPRLFQELTMLPITARILISALLISPLGFFMGMPFPKAALRVGTLIDWGFAINGAASVLGATLILLVAFAWGFTAALLIAAALYLAAWAMLSWKAAW
jgi:hypothetical protein